MTHLRRTDAPRTGFTLVETVIGAAILLVLGLALIESATGVGRLTSSSAVDAQLQEQAQRALRTILVDLKRSGFADLGAGVGYPHVFEDGDADAPFDEHDHAPAAVHAEPGDADFGPRREIVFRLPADADSDGIPDIDGAGNMVWDATDFSFVLVTRADGVNCLERRRNAGSPKVLARHVERVAFETSAHDPVGIPVGAIRVRIWLRDKDERGTWHRLFTEALVDPRNG
jgi:type II secretory pathway pseudopilin PulG